MSDELSVESAPAASLAEMQPPEATGSRNLPQLASYAGLALAVVAVVLAALAYFLPSHHDKPAIAQQGGDAKTNVCSAFGGVRKAVVINTHLQTSDNNPVAELAVAGNARLALVGGGAFLHQRLAANTAAPAELTQAVTAFADTIGQLGVGYLAGGTPDTLQSLRRDLDKQINDTVKACS